MRLNPNAKVPVIVDREAAVGQPYTVFESGAILVYLADKTGQFLPKEGAARYDALQWVMVQMTTIGPMFGQYAHFMRFAPKGNDYSLNRYRTQVRRVLEVLVVPFLGGQSIRSPTSRPSPGPATSEPFSSRRPRVTTRS